ATAFFLTLTDNKYVMLLLVNILLLALGTFMDLAPMLLICTPILLPMMIKLGVDPIHFGMIMLINLGIGLITPPVGPTLFVGCAVDVFPSSSLGNETQINQSLTLATVDMIYTGQLFAGRSHGPISIGGAPFMFRDFDHWRKYAESPLFRSLSAGYQKASGGNT